LVTCQAVRGEIECTICDEAAKNTTINALHPTTGILQFFQDERPSTLSHHKTVAFTVKGATGLLGGRRVWRQRSHVAEGADGQWCDDRFSAAGNHHIRSTTHNRM